MTSDNAAQRWHPLLLSVLSLVGIAFFLWLILGFTGFRQQYAQVNDGWRVGGTYPVELSIVKGDKERLACASDLVREGLHCGYTSNSRRYEPAAPDDRQVLRPYLTTKRQLLLAAGLWSSPPMQETLPDKRFSIICQYRVVDFIKSVKTRWQLSDPFVPTPQSLPVGELKECGSILRLEWGVR